MGSAKEDLVLVGDSIVTSEEVIDGAVFCRAGKITQIVRGKPVLPADCVVEDARGLVLMPGLVDSHVHMNQPGRTHWEGFATASQAAAAGGITTLVDMPLNCTPVTTTRSALECKLTEAKTSLWVDCGFWGGLTPDNEDSFEDLLQSGVLGVKCFLTHSGIDDFADVSEKTLRFAMPILAKHGLPLLVHAELESCVPQSQRSSQHQRSYAAYLASRPDAWEIDAIKLMIALAEEYGCRVHIVHLSSAQALPLIAKAQKRGVSITAETCPHYLSLCAEAVPEGDTRFKCAPPIRSSANAVELWQGLNTGIIDFVVSDHSPCSPDLKKLEEGDFTSAWGGISSLQLALPILWSEAEHFKKNLLRLSYWLAEGPAKLAGLSTKKGKIAIGYDADFVVWDANASQEIKSSSLYFRHKISPYTGKNLRGQVLRTYLRGQKIFSEGKFSTESLGKILLK